MLKLTLAQRFTLLSLNGQQVSEVCEVPKPTSRCVVMAQLLQLLLDEKLVEINKHDCIAGERRFAFAGNDEIITIIKSKCNSSDYTLIELVDQINHFPQIKCDQIAKEIISSMIQTKLLDIVPSLMECDFHYRASGMKSNQYRSSNADFCNEIEYIRDEILGREVIPNDAIYLLWLLIQDGSLGCVLSQEDIVKLQPIMNKPFMENNSTHSLFMININEDTAHSWKSFFHRKNKTTQPQFGSGFKLELPKLQKNKSIFIETEKMFANAEDRVLDVKKMLESNGHIFSVRSFGATSLVEIDNVLYELVPDAIRVRVMNVHGVRLRRYVV